MPRDEPKPPRRLAKADFEHLSSFRRQLSRFLRHSSDLCRAHGLTALQYQLLLHLKGAPGRQWATIGELAECLQARHHGTVALIDRCVEAGLVERRPGRGDRRYTEVHLLAKGARLVERVARLHQPELEHLRERFPDRIAE